MRNPANLFRMMTDLIFVLLGGFLVWLGLSGMVMIFNPRKPTWLGLGAVLVLWGIGAWMQTNRAARTAERTTLRVGGASLVLVGLMMLGLMFVQHHWIGSVLAMAGGILVLRGLIGAALSFRID